jgi:allantoinase
MIVDNLDEMLRQSKEQPLVMGIALHPYLVGQPYRLKHLRRALQHVVKAKKAWPTTPARILEAVS